MLLHQHCTQDYNDSELLKTGPGGCSSERCDAIILMTRSSDPLLNAEAPPHGPRTYVFIEESNRGKSTRVTRACERCHTLKYRCDPPETWPCAACSDFGTGGLPPASAPPLDLSQLDDAAQGNHIYGLTKQVYPMIDRSNSDRSDNEIPSQELGTRNDAFQWTSEIRSQPSHMVSSHGLGGLLDPRHSAFGQDQSFVMLQPENIVTAGTWAEYDSSFPQHPPTLQAQAMMILGQTSQIGRHPDLQPNRPDLATPIPESTQQETSLGLASGTKPEIHPNDET